MLPVIGGAPLHHEVPTTFGRVDWKLEPLTFIDYARIESNLFVPGVIVISGWNIVDQVHLLEDVITEGLGIGQLRQEG